MFCALVILGASLSACSVTKLLSVSNSAPAGSSDFTGLEVVTTIINTGDETFKLLNHPMSVLSKWTTDSFEVNSANGAALDSIGLHVRYDPGFDIKSNDEIKFTVLAP
ncbi:hypothetical protein AAF712_012735 [Marasmius tenuissimus]|uniref:Uncharacterized protein n=1 Tax=Marasmius tenuissimus TaxID=585030 RepID=A0ABR2ZFM5_9AGAR|nr:hypothetical protein PM082_021315 [Marasmius tenuissimus]